MDIKQYINSGVLELYVLDRLPAAEARAVEAMAAEHSEVRAEIDSIEQALEQLAQALAPDVSPEVLDSLLEHPDVTAPRPVERTEATGGDGAQVPKLVNEKAVRGGSNLLTWLLVGLAVLGLAAAAYFWNQQRRQSDDLDDLQLRYDELELNCLGTTDTLRLNTEMIDYLTDPATRDVFLNGTDNAPEYFAMVFYNPESQRTIFRGNNLPPPPTGKQYQLWAIDAGGPKSLGVLDLGLPGDTLLEVDYVPQTATFAVTLEDLGGKPQPDLTALQVLGNVAS